jgi:hypothetical protein
MMNVFDEEMGPLCDQQEAQKYSMLAEAGLTLEEFRTWERLSGNAGAN